MRLQSTLRASMRHNKTRLVILSSLLIAGCWGGRITNTGVGQVTNLGISELVQREVYSRSTLAARSVVSGQPFVVDSVLFESPSCSIDPKRIQLWRVRGSFSHSSPLVVAIVDGLNKFRLSGFQAPELIQLSVTLGSTDLSTEELVCRAKLFAVLTDGGGNEGIVVLAPGVAITDTEVLRMWNHKRPDTWPRESLQVLPDETTLVVVTTLVPSALGEPRWFPAAEAFLMTKSGHILSWSRREGNSFVVE